MNILSIIYILFLIVVMASSILYIKWQTVLKDYDYTKPTVGYIKNISYSDKPTYCVTYFYNDESRTTWVRNGIGFNHHLYENVPLYIKSKVNRKTGEVIYKLLSIDYITDKVQFYINVIMISMVLCNVLIFLNKLF